MVCSRCLINVKQMLGFSAFFLCLRGSISFTPDSPHGHKMVAQVPSLTPLFHQAYRGEKTFVPHNPEHVLSLSLTDSEWVMAASLKQPLWLY